MASRCDGETSKTGVDDTVNQLKLSISKLAEGIQKMGDVLGAVKLESKSLTENGCCSNTATPSTNATDEIMVPSRSREELPKVKESEIGIQAKASTKEMDKLKSAEEIKAQRASKAAEKKARAEAAAAKKAGAVDKKNMQDKSTSSKKVKQKGENNLVTAGDTQPGILDEMKLPSGGKSALRSDGKPLPAREVKFDMSSNFVASPSDESVGSDVPIGPCSEVPEPPTTSHIHPAFLNLAVRCELSLIDEVDSLCLSFIAAFKEYLTDWDALRQKESCDSSSLSHDLSLAIQPQIAHLTEQGRHPLPYALGNMVRQLKKEILKMGKVDSNGCVHGTKNVLKWLDDCEEEYFSSAYRAISEYLLGKIKNTPSVITYDWCPLVNRVLLDAVEKECSTTFTVIDSEMEGNGMRHVQSFVDRRIQCQYTDLNSLGAVVKCGSIVLLGCRAVLSNGCIVAPKGSMLVALVAKSVNVPVLVVSQTLKFVDKVQGGGRVALLRQESTELVPSDLITAIVTDIRVLPPSSAPAVLKAKALDLE